MAWRVCITVVCAIISFSIMLTPCLSAMEAAFLSLRIQATKSFRIWIDFYSAFFSPSSSSRCQCCRYSLPQWKRTAAKLKIGKEIKIKPNPLVQIGCSLHSIHRVTSNRSLANLQKWEVGNCDVFTLLFVIFVFRCSAEERMAFRTLENIWYARIGTYIVCVRVCSNGTGLIRCEILVFALLCFVPFHFEMCFKRIFMCEKCKKKNIDKERSATWQMT